jgi:signal transduction histidine kinase
MNTATIAYDQTASLSEVQSFVHDLRNPLAAIHGSAEILVRASVSQPQFHRLARNMYSASIRMSELLEQCLDRSRRQDRKFEVSDLRDVATALGPDCSKRRVQSVRIVQDVRECLYVSMDRQRIHRVLVNLLVNAMEVMPHGGTIHVSAVCERRSVLIRVRDTGPGIAAEIRDRLFQPFATAGKANGIGLGLAFSRQAVIDHGGEIWAESPRRNIFVILPRTIAKRRIMLIQFARESGESGRDQERLPQRIPVSTKHCTAPTGKILTRRRRCCPGHRTLEESLENYRRVSQGISTSGI